MASEKTPLERALENDDADALANAATQEQLEKLKTAEAVLDARRSRQRFSSRFHIASQALVGYVALLGLGVNAYQSYTNKHEQQLQRELDQQRWSREFDRAQQADKYRAFFETSLLATDVSNRDKRLVGYALLEEFVSDSVYNTKATLMLEESLFQELRRHDKDQFDANHHSAVEAILTALAESPDCAGLERSAKSIDRVAQHKNETGHTDEASRLFGMYVRRLVGHAAEVCGTMREFHLVKAPLQHSLMKVPELGGYQGEFTAEEANERIAQLLGADCTEETQVAGATRCPDILRKYAALCEKSPGFSDEQRACVVIQAAADSLPAASQN